MFAIPGPQSVGATTADWNLFPRPDNSSNLVDQTSWDDIYLKPDGTALYLIDSNSNVVRHYSMSTPWDVFTLSYIGDSSGSLTLAATARGISFKRDGTKAYISHQSTGVDVIRQYTLSSAWDISTLTYDSVEVSVSATLTDPGALWINNAGTQTLIVSQNDQKVYRWTMTSWDLSTLSYASSVSSTIANLAGIAAKDDGSKIFVSLSAGGVQTLFNQYDLAAPFDLTGAGTTLSQWVFAPQGPVNGLDFKFDGSAFFGFGGLGGASYIVRKQLL